MNLCDSGYLDVAPRVKEYHGTLNRSPSELYISVEVFENYAAVTSAKKNAPEIVVKISFRSADRIPLLSISSVGTTSRGIGWVFEEAHAGDHTSRRTGMVPVGSRGRTLFALSRIDPIPKMGPPPPFQGEWQS